MSVKQLVVGKEIFLVVLTNSVSILPSPLSKSLAVFRPEFRRGCAFSDRVCVPLRPLGYGLSVRARSFRDVRGWVCVISALGLHGRSIALRRCAVERPKGTAEMRRVGKPCVDGYLRNLVRSMSQQPGSIAQAHVTEVA